MPRKLGKLEKFAPAPKPWNNQQRFGAVGKSGSLNNAAGACALPELSRELLFVALVALDYRLISMSSFAFPISTGRPSSLSSQIAWVTSPQCSRPP